MIAFASVLESRKITTSVRQTRGLDASAACGQLRNEFQKTPLVKDAVSEIKDAETKIKDAEPEIMDADTEIIDGASEIKKDADTEIQQSQDVALAC